MPRSESFFQIKINEGYFLKLLIIFKLITKHR